MGYEFAHTLVSVVLPILSIVGLGAALHRLRPLQLATLVSLTIYLLIPSYLFVRLMENQLTAGEILRIGGVVLLPMIVVGLAVYAVLRWRQVSPSAISLAVVASVTFNAGNLGIPLAELAFGEAGGRVQAVVMMFVSLTTFLLGYTILSRGQGLGWSQAGVALLRLPYPYVLVLALALRGLHWGVPEPLMFTLHRIKDAMIPIALITLGAQLAEGGRWPRWRQVAPIMAVKLLAMPAVTAVVVWNLGLWPWPGQQLVLASAAPTAVNALLLTMQVEGDAQQAADCVFWTTVASVVTMPLILTWLR